MEINSEICLQMPKASKPSGSKKIVKKTSRQVTKPQKTFVDEMDVWLARIGGLVAIYDAYEKLHPLVSAVAKGLGLAFVGRQSTQDSRKAEAESEWSAIAMGIVAQIFRELRTTNLPEIIYNDPEAETTLLEALSYMFLNEQYVPLFPTIEKIALYQALRDTLPKKDFAKISKSFKL